MGSACQGRRRPAIDTTQSYSCLLQFLKHRAIIVSNQHSIQSRYTTYSSRHSFHSPFLQICGSMDFWCEKLVPTVILFILEKILRMKRMTSSSSEVILWPKNDLGQTRCHSFSFSISRKLRNRGNS